MALNYDNELALLCQSLLRVGKHVLLERISTFLFQASKPEIQNFGSNDVTVLLLRVDKLPYPHQTPSEVPVGAAAPLRVRIRHAGAVAAALGRALVQAPVPNDHEPVRRFHRRQRQETVPVPVTASQRFLSPAALREPAVAPLLGARRLEAVEAPARRGGCAGVVAVAERAAVPVAAAVVRRPHVDVVPLQGGPVPAPEHQLAGVAHHVPHARGAERDGEGHVGVVHDGEGDDGADARHVLGGDPVARPRAAAPESLP